jgi:hypothetical protein
MATLESPSTAPHARRRAQPADRPRSYRNGRTSECVPGIWVVRRSYGRAPDTGARVQEALTVDRRRSLSTAAAGMVRGGSATCSPLRTPTSIPSAHNPSAHAPG